MFRTPSGGFKRLRRSRGEAMPVCVLFPAIWNLQLLLARIRRKRDARRE
jgi:hypothetical protein